MAISRVELNVTGIIDSIVRLIVPAALLCLLSYAGGATTPFVYAAEHWVEIKSPRFSVITDAGEKRGHEVATRFEQMRTVFSNLFLKGRADRPAPLTIFGFRNTKDLGAHSPRWKGKAVELSGYFQQGRDRNFIVLDLSAQQRWRVVFHEYAHLLINSNLKQMPPWFDEGIAEFLSTLSIEGDTVQIGLAPEGQAQFLDVNQLMPVEELFVVQRDSSIYNESGDHRSLFYAQSWLMVHYLMDKKLLGKMDDYVADRNRGASVSEACLQTWGMTARSLDRELKDYLAGAHVASSRFKVAIDATKPGYASRALDRADVDAELADLHMHMPDRRDQARAEFEAVLARKPDQPVAHRGLGYLYLDDDDVERAAASFQRAAAADSDDPYVHYYAGVLRLRAGSHTSEEIARGRRELEQAVALNPGMADAHATLGQLCAMAGDYEMGASALRRALLLKPREERYVLGLANILMLQKHWDAAESLLRPLEKSEAPEITSEAEEALIFIKQLKQIPPDNVRVVGNQIIFPER